jgi:hypothetical protein
VTILDASGRYLADMDEPAPRPAGPWLTNAGVALHTAPRLEYVIPRSALRGAGAREALAGEMPISAEVLAELSIGRRA